MLLSLNTAVSVARTHLPSAVYLRRHAAASIRSTPSHLSLSRSPSSTAIRMSSSDSQSNPTGNHIIEHIVLFKVKPDANPSAVDAMISNLNGLTSLEPVLHLSAGPVARCRSKSLAFTHMLHSRYRSKTDLAAYSDHPTHVSVVANYVRPVVEDVMAVDWVADGFSGPAAVSPGSAVRLTVLKLQESAGESGKGEVLRVVREVKEKFPLIEQLTAGENFSPGRAKGFSICSIAVFKGSKELEELDSEAEAANEEKDKVRGLLDGVLVVDYAVATSVQTASL
ncbi:Stress responsive alpha-beta barrel domain protein [Striga hermonthica]|uniref:Stress responsive alpha-beta barrel domain protein n=1 Tax=Striga hermonthica TaxID=68872 RepID=A0A9N7NS13_STRHE|nr:Stress responsive alpha-beta barrel domain protein [Striga hermonthica]